MLDPSLDSLGNNLDDAGLRAAACTDQMWIPAEFEVQRSDRQTVRVQSATEINNLPAARHPGLHAALLELFARLLEKDLVYMRSKFGPRIGTTHTCHVIAKARRFRFRPNDTYKSNFHCEVRSASHAHG